MCDYPEFSTESDQTCSGRGKPRKCDECGGPIVKGQRYHMISGKWEGEIRVFRMHTACHEISKGQREALDKAGVYWDDMPGLGDMVEYAREDADQSGTFPPYWPMGVYVSRPALAAWVAAQPPLHISKKNWDAVNSPELTDDELRALRPGAPSIASNVAGVGS